MLNPNLIKPTYASLKDIRTKRKVYAPAYQYHGRIFRAKQSRYKTATEALSHSQFFLQGWIMRYQLWVIFHAAAHSPEKVQP